MLADHIGNLIYENRDFLLMQFPISYETLREVSEVLRGIGRLSFPIFAFLLVIGFTHTHDRKKYFSNLLIFGIISQIPYALLFNNRSPIIRGTENLFFVDPNDFYIKSFLYFVAFVAMCIFCYYKFVSRKFKDKGMIILISALALTLIERMKFNYINILGGTNNIFYTLAFGLYACYCYEKFVPLKKQPIIEYLLLIPLAMFGFTFHMDYGAIGIVLIMVLFVARKHKLIQVLIIFIWGFLTYSDFQWGYGFLIDWWVVLGITAAALLVLLYNNKKGYNIKWAFYIFYPAHLLVLGIINVVLLLKAS